MIPIVSVQITIILATFVVARARATALRSDFDAQNKKIDELEEWNAERVKEIQEEIANEIRGITRRVLPMLKLLDFTRQEIAEGRTPPKESEEIEQYLRKWFGSPENIEGALKKLEEENMS